MVGKNSGTEVQSAIRVYSIFAAKLFAIYLSWKLFEFVIGTESQPLEERFFPAISYYWEWLNNQARIMLLHATGFALSVTGYETAISADQYTLNIIPYRGVSVGNYCLAFQLMYFFVCLITISPLPSRVKFWSIPAGLIAIQTMNIFRFVAMHLVIVHFPGWEEKMHDYFFNAIVLALLLLLYKRLLSGYR